jgi:hypothetical protein
VCVFFVVADDVAPHRWQGKEEERKTFLIHCLLPSSAATREPTRGQWWCRVEQCAATVPTLFLQVLEGFPTLLWIFKGLFYNFWIV